MIIREKHFAIFSPEEGEQIIKNLGELGELINNTNGTFQPQCYLPVTNIQLELLAALAAPDAQNELFGMVKREKLSKA